MLARVLAGTVASAAVLALAVSGPEPATTSTTTEPTLIPPLTVERCLEDEPCWDCETMGNRICGPVAETFEVSYTG